MVHDDFADLLRRVTPKPKSVETVRGILENVWNDKRQALVDSRHALERRLAECEQAVQGFLADARTAGPAVKKELYAAVERASADRLEIEKGLTSSIPDDLAFSQDFDAICRFLENPHKAWQQGSVQHRRLIQKLVFKEPPAYMVRENFRNAHYALPFGLFTEFDEQGEGLVDLTPALRKELLAGMEALAEALRFSSFNDM